MNELLVVSPWDETFHNRPILCVGGSPILTIWHTQIFCTDFQHDYFLLLEIAQKRRIGHFIYLACSQLLNSDIRRWLVCIVKQKVCPSALCHIYIKELSGKEMNILLLAGDWLSWAPHCQKSTLAQVLCWTRSPRGLIVRDDRMCGFGWIFGKLPISDPKNYAADFCSNFKGK